MITAGLYQVRRGEPGPAGTLVFLHANGLNASAYAPLLEALPFDGQTAALSLRGHGASALAGDAPRLRDYWGMAEDVLAALEILDPPGRLILAGHSAGAVTALLVAARRPTNGLLMVEPVALRSAAYLLAQTPLRRWTLDQIPIARATRARRRSFASREDVETVYRRKRFFEDWHPSAFAGYLDEGFRQGEEGLTLACDPRWESAIFTAHAHRFWPHLKRVRKKGLPVSILAAKGRSTFKARHHPRAIRLGVPVEVMEGGHMLPAEKPDAVAAWMARALRGWGV